MEPLCFEEIQVGDRWRSNEYLVSREEIIEFASRWDPLPFYTDEEAAAESIFGRLTACIAHLFAIEISLVQTLESQLSMLAGLGLSKFAFPHPVYAGSRLRLQRTIIEMRRSKSKPDRGLITTEHLLLNQDDEVVADSVHKIIIASKSNGNERQRVVCGRE